MPNAENNWWKNLDKFLFIALFLVAFLTHIFYPRDFEEKITIAILSSLTTLVVSNRRTSGDTPTVGEPAKTKITTDTHVESESAPKKEGEG